MSDVEVVIVEDNENIPGSLNIDVGDAIGIFPSAVEQEEFLSWINTRIETAESDISEREADWELWRKDRKNTQNRNPKKRPYPRSANMNIPTTETIVNGISGALRAAAMQKDPPFMVKTLKIGEDEAEENAKAIMQYLTILSRSKNDLDLRTVQREIIFETVSMGTEFAKVPWVHEEKRFRRSAAAGGTNEEFIVSDVGPKIIPIQLENFLYEVNSGMSIDRLEWVGHRFYLTRSELLTYGARGVYENVEQVLSAGKASSVSDHIASVEEDLGISESEPDLFEIIEIWANYDIDGSGVPYDVVVTISQEAETVLKADYNSLGIRPFVNVIYGLYPGFLEGRGVCEMLAPMSATINTINQMRIDNLNINTTSMFKAKRGSGISDKEPIFPGKIFNINGDIGDFVRMEGGNPYSSTLQEEAKLEQTAQRVSGFSDIMGGFADTVAKSGDTFSAQHERLSMGNGQLSSASEAMDMSFGTIGMLILYQLVAHKEVVIAAERKIGRMTEIQLNVLERALDMRVEDIPSKLQFTITSTDIDQSFAAKRQTLLMTAQLLSQYYEKLMQGAQISADPNVPPEMKEIAVKANIAQSKLMEKIIELNEIDDADSYVMNTKLQEAQITIMDLMRDMKALEGQKEIENAKLQIAQRAGSSTDQVSRGGAQSESAPNQTVVGGQSQGQL